MLDTNEIRTSILACMETGNQGRARMLLEELQEFAPDIAQALRMEVVAAYGIHL